MQNRLFFLIFFSLLSRADVGYGSTNYLTIWRYAGQQDFKKAHIMGLQAEGEGFEFHQVGELKSVAHGAKICNSLLQYGQALPLSIYLDWGYLSKEQAAFQNSVEKTVSPDRVTFTEVSALVPDAEVKARRKPLPVNQRGRILKSVFKIRGKSMVELRKSSMWMISGLTLEPSGLEVHNFPWQDDPGLKGNPRLRVDRKKYFYAWEFGRASQVEDGLIEDNLRALTLLAYQEMVHMGGILEDNEGYIFIHSLGASRTRVFKEVHGAKPFVENWNNDANCVLILKLSDLMTKYKPREMSTQVNKIIELSGNTLDDFQALKIFDDNLKAFRNDLDLRSSQFSNQRGPIVVEDMTFRGYRKRISASLAEFGVPQKNIEDILIYLSQNIYNENSSSPSYFDYSFIKNAWSRYAKENAIQISNLDEKEALKSPDYLPTVISGVYGFYSRSMPLDNERFCVRTSSPKMSEQLTSMGSKMLKKLDGDSHGHPATIYLHFFTLDQVKQMTHLGTESVVEGYWTRRRLLSHPRQF